MRQTVFDAVEAIVPGAYLVGGAVRDTAIDPNSMPKDFDFATSVLPDDIERLVRLAGRRAYTIGKRFGTIGFKVDGKFVEVTTYRRESYDADSRKPQVAFTDQLAIDLSRRDFTCNAMAMNWHGRVVDPFGGWQDIQSRVLRAVGNPTLRFKEDPLRLLRACRLAARLGFTIEPKTMRSMQKNAHLILKVSRERWVDEMDKMLLTDKPSVGLRLLADSGLLRFMLPELAVQVGYEQNSRYHNLTLWEHTLRVADGVPADIDLRWAALLHDVGKPATRTDKADRSNYIMHERVGAEMVERLALYLKWSNDRRRAVGMLVKNHLNDASPLRAADNAGKDKTCSLSELA